MTIEAGIPGVNQNPLAYTGVPTNVVPCQYFERAPTTADVGYPFMFHWGDATTGNVYIRVNTTSVWDQLAEGSGVTSVAQGGTGRFTLTDHALLVGDATAPVGFVGPAATGTILQGAGASADPAFSTATYPATTTINQILYSSAANTVAGLATANNGSFVTSATGVPSVLAGPGTTGNILQSNAAAAPSFSTATYPVTTAQGDLLLSSAANTVTALAKDANATRYLSNTGASNNAAWAQIDVTNGVTGTLPVANGGTGAATMSLNALIVGNTTSPVLEIASAAARTILQGGGVGVIPAFSTAAYPATTAQGDLLLSSAANDVTVLAKDANATRYLANTGASNNAQWDQINLTNGVTGTLPIANGGTGLGGSEGTVQTTDATPANALTIALGATPLTYMITAYVSAYASVGIGTPLGAGFFVQGAVRTTGAAATLIAQTPTPYAEGALAAATAVLAVSANNALITVTGVALYTVDWKVDVISVTQGA